MMKKKMGVVIGILLILLELIWLLCCIDGVLLFIDNRTSEVFRLTVACCIHAILMLVITIGGILRKKKRESFSMGKTIAMLPIATILWFGVSSWFVLDTEARWTAGTLFVFIGLAFTGLLHLCFSRKKPKVTHRHYSFTHIKSEWSFDAVQQEYCSMYGIAAEQLTQDDLSQIQAYASHWIVYFLEWLIRHGFFLCDEQHRSAVDDILAHKTNPLELFAAMDHCLSMEQIDPQLGFFMTQYFAFSPSAIGSYHKDYLSVVHAQGTMTYCLDYSEELYAQIEKLVDFAYLKYGIQNAYDDLVSRGRFRCPWNAKWNMEIMASPEVPADYIDACCDHFRAFTAARTQQLCEAIRAHWITTDTFDSDEALIQHSYPDTITIYKPYGAQIVYIIGCEPDYEVEHGMAFVVCEDSISDIGYRLDIEGCSPWLERIEKERD